MADLTPLFTRLRRQVHEGATPANRGGAERLRCGPYELVRALGHGGMGEVWQAVDARSGKTVALKFLAEDLARDAHSRARFLAEGEVLRRLVHPGIVRVLGLGDADGEPYLVLEFIDGESLRSILRAAAADRRALCHELVSLAAEITASHGTVARADELDTCVLEWTRLIALALHDAHQNGVVHRDVTPGNVLIDRSGRARLIDFGVARSAATADLTRGHSAPGTPGYLAPEAWAGSPVQASDIFSLSAVLFEALSGRRPYQDPADRLQLGAPEVRHGTLLGDLRRDLQGPVERVLSRGLAWRAEERYASALALAEDLARLQRHQKPAAPAPPWRERWTRHARRDPWRAKLELASVAAALLAVVLAVPLAVMRSRAAAEGRLELERQRRQQAQTEIRAVLAEITGGGLRLYRTRERHLETLARHAEHGASALVAEALDGVTQRLRAAREELWRSAGATPEVARALAPVHREADVPPESVAAYRDARAELERLGAKTLPALLAEAAEQVMDEPTLEGVETCCSALARLNDPRSAVPSLEGYLVLEPDEWRATQAGAALATLARDSGDARAARAVAHEARRFPAGGVFWSLAYLQLPAGVAGASAALGAEEAAVVAGAGRRPHGEIRDASGGWLLNPLYLDSWLGLGLPRDGRRPAAGLIADAEVAIRANPQSAAAWLAMGRAQRVAGALGESIRALLVATELTPADPEPWRLRGDVRRVSGDVAGAVRDFEHVVELAPRQADGWALLTMARNDAGDREGALAAAARALELEPGLQPALLYRGMARHVAGDLEGALEDLRAAVPGQQNPAEALHALGCTLLALGRTEEALEAARSAVRADKVYALGWNGLGVALVRRGDALHAQGREEEARRSWTEAEEKLVSAGLADPRLPFAHLNLGAVLLRGRRWEAAADAFAAAIDRVPWLPHGYLGRALAAAGRGDSARARKDAEQVLALAPEDPRADVARDLLKGRPPAMGVPWSR